MWERLDCAVGTTKWYDKFPATTVLILDCGSSDHKPFVVHPCGILVKINKPWRFEQI